MEMNNKFGKEKFDVGSNPNTVQELYGEKADSASVDGRNPELLERLIVLNTWQRELMKDLVSDDPEVRKRAEIRSMLVDDHNVHVVKENGRWVVR